MLESWGNSIHEGWAVIVQAGYLDTYYLVPVVTAPTGTRSSTSIAVIAKKKEEEKKRKIGLQRLREKK